MPFDPNKLAQYKSQSTAVLEPETLPRFGPNKLQSLKSQFKPIPEFRQAQPVSIPEKILRIFRQPPEQQVAKAQNIYAISKATGMPLKDVEKNYQGLVRQERITGIRPDIGRKEYPSLITMPLVAAGLATQPIPTILGLGAFTALDKLIDLNKFVPSDASDEVKTVVELADFIGKGAIVGGIFKKSPTLMERFTKSKLAEYNLPRTIKLSSGQVRDIFQTGKLTTSEQQSLFGSLGLTGQQYRNALREGVDINIPAEKIVQIIDKPYWARLKSVLGIKPYSETRMFRPGQPKVAPSGLLPQPEITPSNLVSKNPTIQKAYEGALSKIPNEIKKDINIKGIRVIEFPEENQGEGGRLEIDGKGNHFIFIEKGEENLTDTILHEAVHSYVLKHPEVVKKDYYFGMEDAVNKIASQIEKGIEKPPIVLPTKSLFSPQKLQKIKSAMPQEDLEKILFEKATEDYLKGEVGEADLYKIISQEGGIKPYVKGMAGALREEYREDVPIHLRRKSGLPLDEMADILKTRYPHLGIETESDLLEVLNKQKSLRMYAGMPLTTPEKLREIKDKLIVKFDIEYPFKQLGAPQTGLAIKTYLSKRATGEEKTLRAIQELGKFNLAKEDYTKLAFIAERPTLFYPMSEEQRKGYSPAYNYVRGYFDDYFRILQTRAPEKFELPWPESHIRRLQEENQHIKEAILKTGNTERQETLASRYKENQELINFYKTSHIQYIHLPVRLWLGELFNKDPQRAKQLISGTFKAILGRETPTLKHLVDAGIIKREEVDIRDIMAAYGRYVENQIAQYDILQMAKEEGLAKLEGLAPEEWVNLPPNVAPALKGFKLHPAFADNLEQYYKAISRGQGSISRLMATIKMMQFYNPVILPMYDLVQAGLMGAMTTYKLPIYYIQAIKDVVRKTPEYFKASEEGLDSTPFVNPYENFLQQVEAVKRHQNNNGNYLLDALARLKEYPKTPQEILKDIYNASWTVAWSLDKVIRMASRYYLIEKGLTPLEASQLAAKFSGDYASVPPQTRKVLNKIFFTPTFEIAMDKVYWEMLKNAFNPKVLKGKGEKTQNIYARGLIYMAGILFGKDAIMTYGLGFNRDQFSRRYTKQVEVEGAPKELVTVFSNPANVPLRYYYQIKFDEAETNYFLRVANTIKNRLHPVYNIAMAVIRNEGDNFKPVYNPFDEPKYQLLDMVKYITGKSIRISEGFVRGEDILTVETQKALKDSTNSLWAGILRPITFRYLRSIQDQREAFQMKNLANEFQKVLIREPKMDEERYLMRLKNFQERLEKISNR